MKEKIVEEREMKHHRKIVTESNLKEAKNLLRTKLEMNDIGNNWGKERKCGKCDEKETTEHILVCWGGEDKIETRGKLEGEDKKELEKIALKIEHYIRERDLEGLVN